MRKLVVTEFLSLDGVMENPMWTFPYWNDEIAAFKGEETSANEPLLLGRITYEGFAAAWPQRKDEDPGAPYFNGTRKYVVSTTLKEPLEWNNAVLIKDNIVEAIGRLKQEDGPDIMVHGSGRLIHTLMQHDLIDMYRLLIYPLVLGKGQRLFEDQSQTKLKLVSSKALTAGVVALVYQPDRQ
jgi:dihydrofolate reductase